MQIITFFRSIFAKTSWYFFTVCSSNAFLTSAFWGLTKRSTSGVVDPLDEEELDEKPELLCSASFEFWPVLLAEDWLPLEEFVPLLICSFVALLLFSEPSFAAFFLSPILSVTLACRFFLEDPFTSLHRSSAVTFSLSMPRATRSNAVVVVSPEDSVVVSVSIVVSGVVSMVVSWVCPPPTGGWGFGPEEGAPIPWNTIEQCIMLQMIDQ